MLHLPIAISTGPQTRTLTALADRLLSERRRLVRTYEADGAGGRQLEADVLAGRIAAVLDLTLTELVAELLGLPGGAGPDRLTAAAIRGVPQVIGFGGLEAILASRGPTPRESPGGYAPGSPEFFDRLGKEIAQKASAAGGPVTILISKSDVSPVLVQSLHNWLSPHVGVRELDCHADDPAFAIAAVDALELDRR